MKIQYFGHSSFLLEMGDARIVTDPFGDVGIPMPHAEADAVTVSHAHYDHCNVAAVRAPLVLSEAGEYRVKDVRVTARERFHDDAGGRKRGKTLVFRFEGEGISLLHLGDLGEPFSSAVAEAIGHADVLLLPVGGNYTIDAVEAKKYADAIDAAVVIPMHYKVKGLTVDISGVGPFLSLFPEAEQGGSVLELSARSLQAGRRIICMERCR